MRVELGFTSWRPLFFSSISFLVSGVTFCLRYLGYENTSLVRDRVTLFSRRQPVRVSLVRGFKLLSAQLPPGVLSLCPF